MWDEELNKKIKDAADQYHPAYDDDAWNQMEQLLDVHLPQKKDRRRIIYLLPLLVLFLGGGIFFVISRKEPTKSSAKILSKNNTEKSPGVVAVPDSASSGKHLARVMDGEKYSSKKLPIKTGDPRAKITGKLFAHRNGNIINRNNPLAYKDVLQGEPAKQSKGKSLSIESNEKRNPIKNSNDGINEPVNTTGKPSGEAGTSPIMAENASKTGKANDVVPKDDKPVVKDDKEIVKPKDIAKIENTKKDKNDTRQKKLKKSFVENFGIGLSIGPDVSAVKLSNTGKITLTYGAGLNYSLSKKFTLRTGLYFARKIYSVDENEYHVPPGSSWSNDLQSVDANCKVFEIPLTISYNFGKTTKHNWFASAGLSSYFMKKEAYVYYYKNPAGNTWDYPWAVKNQNKHYFSVLDISAGYRYSINKQFSILAEPYLKLPLGGIGAGKIKLNSAGVLFTVAVRPFLR